VLGGEALNFKNEQVKSKKFVPIAQPKSFNDNKNEIKAMGEKNESNMKT
jgi:hypothetical protein